MPYFAVVIGTLFASLLGFFAKYFTKKIALGLAFIALLIAITAAFVATIEALFLSIYYFAPVELNSAMSMFLPSNFKVCISAIIGAKLALWVYTWNVKVLQFKFDFK